MFLLDRLQEEKIFQEINACLIFKRNVYSEIVIHYHSQRETLHTMHSKICMIQAGITCTVYAVQSRLPSVQATQQVLCNKCSLARSQWACRLNIIWKTIFTFWQSINLNLRRVELLEEYKELLLHCRRQNGSYIRYV